MIRNWMLRRRFRKIGMRPPSLLGSVDGQDHSLRQCGVPPSPDSHPTCDHLRRLVDARKLRADFFGSHLFVDPAWDILLLAYVALLEDEPFLISTLCRTSTAPATTTLRWINVLEQEGWLARRDDPLEGQGSRLSLTSSGKVAMEAYLGLVGPSIAF